MTKKTSLALLAFIALASILYAQQQRISRAAIDVRGVKLRLGMTQTEVAEKLAGKEITKSKEDIWMVSSSNELGPALQFTNGRLSFADRYWVTYDNDITEALFGAVNSLNQEGFSECRISTDIKTDPKSQFHRIWINCGEKSILVARLLLDGKTYNTVTEQLGSMRSTE